MRDFECPHKQYLKGICKVFSEDKAGTVLWRLVARTTRKSLFRASPIITHPPTKHLETRNIPPGLTLSLSQSHCALSSSNVREICTVPAMCPCKRNPEKASVKARQAKAAEYLFQSFYWVSPNTRGRIRCIHILRQKHQLLLLVSPSIHIPCDREQHGE